MEPLSVCLPICQGKGVAAVQITQTSLTVQLSALQLLPSQQKPFKWHHKESTQIPVKLFLLQARGRHTSNPSHASGALPSSSHYAFFELNGFTNVYMPALM